jgi:aryl-alcohol dehydrogenase-like predicted oxidoreductase
MIPERVLGPGAPAVSAVGLGGMPLSIQGRPDSKTAASVVHASLDAGMTLIDTADVYCIDDRDLGHNERLIEQAVRAWTGSRDRLVIATKGGLTRPDGRWERDGRPSHLVRACDRSLSALGVEQIDVYQLHAPDPSVDFLDSVGALVTLQEQGKIRWIGLSNVTVEQIREAQSIADVVTVQNRLNPFFREALDSGVVAYCTSQGIGFIAYSPVGGGRLHKKLPNHEVACRIATAYDATPHEVVLAWVLAQGSTVFVIPGARTVDHALSSVRAASIELAAEDLAAITSASFSRA